MGNHNSTHRLQSDEEKAMERHVSAQPTGDKLAARPRLPPPVFKFGRPRTVVSGRTHRLMASPMLTL